ncbi:chemotaxis protein CheW [Caulobacter sp. RHG1]|uniref:chemotaxis protein CheW n=1 Tax=Caulobacter sp. (strain RHG1) TaxID=2545762 RepID=UPI001884D8D6|nr:chemotaxis protein CheW [Caulobacter sp. RHG1]NQE64286.1 Positive regulator of CheA protein activity (CheW) [Caulobacter sp. RHG1]
MGEGAQRRLTVRAGDARVSLPTQAVAEVIRRPKLTRMPHAPEGLLGVTHLRGAVLPVVSLSELLGLTAGDAARVVVLRREPPVGLAVDGVEALSDEDAGKTWQELEAALVGRFARGEGRRTAAKASAMPAPAAPDHAEDRAFFRVDLAGQAYGFPLESVVEVAAVPDVIADLPRTEVVLLGVCAYRGGLLPVLSGRALLGLPERPGDGGERLVVLNLSGERLGLVVDRLEAIVRASPDRLSRAPSVFNRGGGEARIDTVLRLADDRGVLAILTPERLLADERVTQWLALAAADEEAQMALSQTSVARERFIVLRLGEERYGLPIGAVDEVVRAPEQLSRMPKAPAYVQGVMSLRGKAVPVIDQRMRLGVSGQAAGPGRVVVVTVDRLQAGFAVDAASEVLEVAVDELLAAPELTGPEARLFDRAVERGGELILLIDPKALLERAEADLLRDLAKAVTPS